MTAHDWYIENRIAFATRTLDAKEEALFAGHLGRCAECQQAVADLERELAWLPTGVTPVAPRPGLTRQVAQGVLEQRSRWWRWTAVFAAAAVLLFGLRGWADARSRISRLSGALATSQGQLSAIKDSLSAIVGAERVFQETVKREGFEGGFLIFYDHDTERWNVVVHDLPPAGVGEVYQLWFITNRGLRPGPELRVDGTRPTFLTLPAPDSSSSVVGALLSVGPRHGGADVSPGVELARVRF